MGSKKDEITSQELDLMLRKAQHNYDMQQAKTEYEREYARAKWKLAVARWDKPKAVLPEPDFSLDEIAQAQEVIDDLQYR